MMRAPLSAIPDEPIAEAPAAVAPESGARQNVNWRGRSGRYYAMREERIADAVLGESGLYLVVRDAEPLWAGTAAEVIGDQASREKFRAAMRTGTAVLCIAAPGDDVECMKLKWDIEGGRRAGALALVP